MSTILQTEPPSELSADEAQEWRAIIAAVGPIPVEMEPLLSAWCRHVCLARYLGRALAAQRKRDLPLHLHRTRELSRIAALAQAHAREGRALLKLSPAIRRLTAQGRSGDVVSLFRDKAS